VNSNTTPFPPNITCFPSNPKPLISNLASSDQTVDQIINLLKCDQYLRLVQMIDRHTKTDVYHIIQDFGRALRFV
jgi:hypothetical protein